jgi:hypothetical protein
VTTPQLLRPLLFSRQRRVIVCSLFTGMGDWSSVWACVLVCSYVFCLFGSYVFPNWPFEYWSEQIKSVKFLLLFIFLSYTPSGRGFDSIWDHWAFISHLSDPSSRTIALGLTPPLPEISTRNISGGKAWPTSKKDTITAICEPTV